MTMLSFTIFLNRHLWIWIKNEFYAILCGTQNSSALIEYASLRIPYGVARTIMGRGWGDGED